eukprot:scaffold918_cov126-Cylindrotheca_fusiformis.AAC.66
MTVESTSESESPEVGCMSAKDEFWQFGPYEKLMNESKKWINAETEDGRQDQEEASAGGCCGVRDGDNGIHDTGSIVNAPSEEIESDDVSSNEESPETKSAEAPSAIVKEGSDKVSSAVIKGDTSTKEHSDKVSSVVVKEDTPIKVDSDKVSSAVVKEDIVKEDTPNKEDSDKVSSIVVEEDTPIKEDSDKVSSVVVEEDTPMKEDRDKEPSEVVKEGSDILSPSIEETEPSCLFNEPIDKLPSPSMMKAMFDEMFADVDVTEAKIDKKEEEKEPQEISLLGEKKVTTPSSIVSKEQSPVSWDGLLEEAQTYFSSVFRPEESPIFVARPCVGGVGTQISILQRNLEDKTTVPRKHVQWNLPVEGPTAGQQDLTQAQSCTAELQKAFHQEVSVWDMIDNFFLGADYDLASAGNARGASTPTVSQNIPDVTKKCTVMGEWTAKPCCSPALSKLSISELNARWKRAAAKRKAAKSAVPKLLLMDKMAASTPAGDGKRVSSLKGSSKSTARGKEGRTTSIYDTSIPEMDDIRSSSLLSEITSEIESLESQISDDSSQCPESKNKNMGMWNCGNLDSISMETPRAKNTKGRNTDLTHILLQKRDGQRIEHRQQQGKCKRIDPPECTQNPTNAATAMDPDGEKKSLAIDPSLLSSSGKKQLSGSEPLPALHKLEQRSKLPLTAAKGDSPFSPLMSKSDTYQPVQERSTTKSRQTDPPATTFKAVRAKKLVSPKKNETDSKVGTTNSQSTQEVRVSADSSKSQKNDAGRVLVRPVPESMNQQRVESAQAMVEEALRKNENVPTSKRELLRQMLPLSQLQPHSIAVVMDITSQMYMENPMRYNTIYEQTRACVRAANSKLKEPLDEYMVSDLLMAERRRFDTHIAQQEEAQ